VGGKGTGGPRCTGRKKVLEKGLLRTNKKEKNAGSSQEEKKGWVCQGIRPLKAVRGKMNKKRSGRGPQEPL